MGNDQAHRVDIGIVVKSRRAFNRLEIEIQDEGIGIKRKDLEEVFEPCPAQWRGIGEVASSGLKLRKQYQRFDTRHDRYHYLLV